MVSRIAKTGAKSQLNCCDGRRTIKRIRTVSRAVVADACCWGSGVVQGDWAVREIGLGELKNRASEEVRGSVQCLARMKSLLLRYSPVVAARLSLGFAGFCRCARALPWLRRKWGGGGRRADRSAQRKGRGLEAGSSVCLNWGRSGMFWGQSIQWTGPQEGRSSAAAVPKVTPGTRTGKASRKARLTRPGTRYLITLRRHVLCTMGLAHHELQACKWQEDQGGSKARGHCGRATMALGNFSKIARPKQRKLGIAARVSLEPCSRLSKCGIGPPHRPISSVRGHCHC